MNREAEILGAADYSKKIEYGKSSLVLIVNNRLKKHNGMFGFVVLKNDFDEAKGLFEAAERRARELGFRELIGPLNYNTWMSYRWALNRYDVKYYPDCENEAYHVDFIRRLGYSELYTYRSAHVKLDNALFGMSEGVYRQKLDEGFTFRFVSNDEAFALAGEIFDLCRDAFAGGILYSEISRGEFETIYLSQLKAIDGVEMIAAFDGGEPAGFSMGYVDPFDRRHYISKTTAVRKKYQHQRLYLALLYLGYRHIRELGYDDVVYHYECEQRPTFHRFDGGVESNEKRYAVFKKELEA